MGEKSKRFERVLSMEEDDMTYSLIFLHDVIFSHLTCVQINTVEFLVYNRRQRVIDYKLVDSTQTETYYSAPQDLLHQLRQGKLSSIILFHV